MVSLDAFISKWTVSGASERANKDPFLLDLCAVLGVPTPAPSTGDAKRDLYVFEKDILTPHEGRWSSIGKADLYKHGCFLLEAKQGSERGSKKLGSARRGTPGWNIAMRDAFGQALGYTKWLAEPPPFVITCDIGHCLDIYATFDGTTAYRPFPNPSRHRIYVADIADHLDTLRAIFTEPLSLDPSLHAARVTRDVAGHLANLAKSLEATGNHPELVARFLMRCIFTMFAEDVGLLPDQLFTKALTEYWVPSPRSFPGGVEGLWRAMNDGSSFGFVGRLLHFNGGLFRAPSALALTTEQLQLLLEAAKCRWGDVEPAIFGTLLERALNPKERHKLGAHFTPPAFVQRLVRETIEEPLRADWSEVQATVRKAVESDRLTEAKKAVRAFHTTLCNTRVLDPACGSGNFLYVALDFFKRLEGEVLAMLVDLEKNQRPLRDDLDHEVTPAQFFGIEVKPWAKEIAELVLWIGYLQWHFKGHKGQAPREPVLRDYQNVACRDAILASDAQEVLRDSGGRPVSRWDRESRYISATTGQLVPDDEKRVPVYAFANPRPASAWPEVEFIVGNPPFLGKLFFLDELGEGYVEALRDAYRGVVPDGCDLVMYWWHRAAELVRGGKLRRFGFITTKSITQTFNRRVVSAALTGEAPLHLAFAIPNHPWVDSADGAAVRIAMTVAQRGPGDGILMTVTEETPGADDIPQLVLERAEGVIHANLKLGTDITAVRPLQANALLASMGPMLGSRGFVVKEEERAKLVRADGAALAKRIRPLASGRDLVQRPRSLYAIDLHGLTSEQAKKSFGACYQHLRETVYPERAQNKDQKLREEWWLFRRSNDIYRSMLKGLLRFVATTETAKHRVFTFVDADTIAEHGTISIGSDDAYVLGVLSSRIHVVWALAAGGRLGVGNHPRYNKTKCFDPFAFPTVGDAKKQRIRDLAEELDAHRKRQIAKHPKLTITAIYNALEALREGRRLTEVERATHDASLGTVLAEIHDQLDAAVADAYGWPVDASDEDIIESVADLNAQRLDDERHGNIEWLRPDFQKRAATQLSHPGLTEVVTTTRTSAPAERRSWPPKLSDQVAAVRNVLGRGVAWQADEVARAFDGADLEAVNAVLESLAVLGLAVAIHDEKAIVWKGGDRLASVRPPGPTAATKAG